MFDIYAFFKKINKHATDTDGDEKLTEDEFADMPSDNDDYKDWTAQRRREFRENIDINHDGKVTREELLVSCFSNIAL